MKQIAAYLRVSTDKQSLETSGQRNAILAWAKQNHIRPSSLTWYQDKASGATVNRKDLNRLLSDIDEGKIDVLLFHKLDRLARSTREGLELLAKLADKGIRVVAVAQGIDFNGSAGKFLSTIFLAVAELERSMISERQKASVAARRAAGGHRFGRKPNIKRLRQIQRMRDKGMTLAAIGEKLGVSLQSVQRSLKRADSLS